MIIWGTKGRRQQVTQGQFHCPKCDTDRRYAHMRVARYFTLFFIPLFRLKTLGEYIECQACRTAFDLKVLDYRPPSSTQKALIALRRRLEDGMPVAMVRNQLVAGGTEPEQTDSLMELLLMGRGTRTCAECGNTYCDVVDVCSNCGARLPVVSQAPAE